MISLNERLARARQSTNPHFVLFLLAVFYAALLVLNAKLAYFGPDADLNRLPAWPPLSYSTFQEVIAKQPTKHWIVVGDSVIHGDTGVREQSVGYWLSKQAGFINLSNPSLSFQSQALLLQAILEQYPDKAILLQINPMWLVDSWIPDKFQPLKSELGNRLKMQSQARTLYLGNERSPAYRKYRLINFLSLDALRCKIQYRWLNQNLSSYLLKRLRRAPDGLFDKPFNQQEIFLSRRGDENRPLNLSSSIEATRHLLDNPTIDLQNSASFQALWEITLRWRPKIAVVLTPLNPYVLRAMSPQEQQQYQTLHHQFEDALESAGIPYLSLRLPGDCFVDNIHYNMQGHLLCRPALAEFLNRIK